MLEQAKFLIDQLEQQHTLTTEAYVYLLTHAHTEIRQYAAKKANAVRQKIYGTDVYIRGLIEISNYCKNDCYYCGIRRSNHSCNRYRLTEEEILTCCADGYALGFRTFVLQGGEDGYYSDTVLEPLLIKLKQQYPDVAITLSLGERSEESYQRLFHAGADRYLLRHETASKMHYQQLHPPEMSYQNRLRCLHALREIGYQVGCGMMVGSPYQTPQHLAADLMMIQTFQPEMCGIGPFIPHPATPFADEPAGSVDLTCFLLSLIRLAVPHVLLPATTALATLDKHGREKGMLAGANVVMPNLSPTSVRGKYELYQNKRHSGAESAQQRRILEAQMAAIGFVVKTDRGDAKRNLNGKNNV